MIITRYTAYDSKNNEKLLFVGKASEVVEQVVLEEEDSYNIYSMLLLLPLLLLFHYLSFAIM